MVLYIVCTIFTVCIVAIHFFSGYKDVCLVLVKHGADIHLEDADGDTPLKLAQNEDLKRDMRSKSMQISKFALTGKWEGPLINFACSAPIPCGILW